MVQKPFVGHKTPHPHAIHSAYQHKLNSGLTGALGPASAAYWPSTTTTTGKPYGLAAQPLYFSPSLGKYVTSPSLPAYKGSIDFSSFKRTNYFGRRKRRRSFKNRRSFGKRKSRKTRKSRKSRKTRKSRN